MKKPPVLAMGSRTVNLLLLVIVSAAGCAAPRRAAPATAPSVASVSATKTNDKALLTLEQIQPPLTLAAATQPSVQATTQATVQAVARPSLDAIELFARARDASAQGQRYMAITQLEKAIGIDPQSYELRFELGKAYLAISHVDERAAESFEKAAAIQPDHLDLQTQLGRQYLARGDLKKGIERLRLALLTSEYRSDEGGAAVADFLLARALKEAGYDRAALDRYQVLLDRFKSPSLRIRQNPELTYLISRPEVMYEQIGELYERNGAYAEALKAYTPAAEHDPTNINLQSRVARTLASLGRRDEALSKAADLIVRARATPESLELLRDVCRRLQLAGGEIDALQQLHRDRPQDRAVLGALADSLLAQHRNGDAERLLAAAWQKSPGDIPLTRRLFALYKQRDDVPDAARLLVVALARDPDTLRNLSPLWNALLRSGQRNRLRLPALQAMPFPANAEASRQFWISRIAELFHRDALARSALQRSIRSTPPFAPAFRALLAQTWAQDELSAEQKIAAGDRLADLAAAGDAALASELRGLSLLNQKKLAEASAMLQRAIEQGSRSPDLFLAHAVAARKPGKDPQFEQAVWKLISDRPMYEDAYAILFRYYADSDVGSLQQAMKVLSTWLGNDPQSLSARLVEANVDTQLGQTADADNILQQLFAQDPDNPEVLEGLRQFYTQTRRLDQFIAKLEDYRAQHPQDTDVVAKLVGVYSEQKRVAEATRVLDSTRTATASDPDLLYNLAQIHARLDQKQACEDVLQQIVRLDPAHASASNDLGYTWADQGKRMAEAESLIRVAVAAEPDNESFLDSLGWVLYKRGKFDEARSYLEQAVGPAAFPDPIVLDHLGDTFYRLSRNTDAARQWQRSLKGIGEGETDRDDLKALRLQLLQKIKAAETNKPVQVAPTVESAAATVQAKQ